MAQFGTGSSLLGGSSALAQAMASRGVDSSILNQQSPASAGGVQPIPTPQTSQSASPVVPEVPTINPQTSVTGTGAPSSEAELIIKALTGRLNTLSKAGV